MRKRYAMTILTSLSDPVQAQLLLLIMLRALQAPLYSTETWKATSRICHVEASCFKYILLALEIFMKELTV